LHRKLIARTVKRLSVDPYLDYESVIKARQPSQEQRNKNLFTVCEDDHTSMKEDDIG